MLDVTRLRRHRAGGRPDSRVAARRTLEGVTGTLHDRDAVPLQADTDAPDGGGCERSLAVADPLRWERPVDRLEGRRGLWVDGATAPGAPVGPRLAVATVGAVVALPHL